MSERKWFYMNNEQKEGPIAESNLRQMVSKQILQPDVMVWTEGMSGWEPASHAFATSQSPVAGEPTPVEWFYGLNDAKHGPVSEAQIRSLLQNGTLSSASLLWCERFTDWKPAASVPEFSNAIVPPVIPPVGRASSNEAPLGKTASPQVAGTAQKSGNSGFIVALIGISLVIVIGAIAGAVFLGKGLLGVVGQNSSSGQTNQSTQADQNMPGGQNGQGDQAAPGTQYGIDRGVQGNSSQKVVPGTSSSALPAPGDPDPSSIPVGLPPPPYVEEVSKVMLAKLDSSKELNQIDCSNIPDKDPDFDQNLGIMDGTVENHTGNTIWKCDMGHDSLYMVYDYTFSKMYGYSMKGKTEIVANLVLSSQNAPFPKEMYIYEYPSGEVRKFGILARPNVLYAFSKNGGENGYFSGTEFIEHGKPEGTITVFPSK
ncbi:MAG: DUF4339 domain-containing protein [Candidatus Obscuribacterales bacterium]|nr:DUF4339 domain-containing protein [Candidatus Obscuribacterales bacterium]